MKPLFKRGDVCQLNNYRPISLLPTISKVFERVIYSQLYTYFSENNLLSEQQYGFRAQHSTELAVNFKSQIGRNEKQTCYLL